MIVNIDKDKKDAAETQTIVAAEEEAAQTKAAETKAIADDAQRDLDEALPALEEAVKCLNSLKKSDIDEVRTMGKPPAGAFRVKLEKETTPGLVRQTRVVSMMRESQRTAETRDTAAQASS
jgi:dynein heavy chain